MIIAFGLAFSQPPADPPKPTITGDIVDASGAVIPGAKVTLFRGADSVPIAVTKTDSNGKYEFSLEEKGIFKVVAESKCFEPTVVAAVAGKLDRSTQLSPITLQLAQVCLTGLMVVPVIPVTLDPAEPPRSVEPPKKVKIVTVCELLENIQQYANTSLAVVGRLDQPGESLIDRYEFLAQDHCAHPIATKEYVWPSKVFISVQTEEELPGPLNDQPEMDHTLLAEKFSAVRKATKLGFHKRPQFKNEGGGVKLSKFADVRDEWAVAYGLIFWSPNLKRQPCGGDEIGCGEFLGAPSAIIVAPKNLHVINKDGTIRSSSEQDGK